MSPNIRAHERVGLAVIVLSFMQAFIGFIKVFTQFTFRMVREIEPFAQH